jgi:2,4-dienoyl-CoA reductase
MASLPQAPPLPKGTFQDRIVLITGGGTGLGYACALRFAFLGASVVITGRRESVLLKARDAIIAAGAPAALAIPMDVRDPKSVKAGIDRIETELGRLPCIVLNNAAGNFISPSERLSPNAWKAVVDIVLMGTIHVTTEVAKRWIAKRPVDAEATDPRMHPQVVFMQVGASYVERGTPFLAPSAAAKAAVLNLTQSLSVEWGKYNIRLFMVSPGPIYTKGAFERLDPTGKMINGSKKDLPLQRMGTTNEYADFATYLCSPFGSWLTGANIFFDGGSAAAGGEFTALRTLDRATWDSFEKAIRRTNESDKATRAVMKSKL